MVLVDSSVWIDHLWGGNRTLKELLERTEVLCHPMVIGELACGRLRNRGEIMNLLSSLPRAPLAGDAELLLLLERRELHGRGLGWIDLHLLASASLGETRLWALDPPLAGAAASLNLAFELAR